VSRTLVRVEEYLLSLSRKISAPRYRSAWLYPCSLSLSLTHSYLLYGHAWFIRAVSVSYSDDKVMSLDVSRKNGPLKQQLFTKQAIKRATTTLVRACRTRWDSLCTLTHTLLHGSITLVAPLDSPGPDAGGPSWCVPPRLTQWFDRLGSQFIDTLAVAPTGKRSWPLHHHQATLL